MLDMTLIYQNQITLNRSANGWCLLSREDISANAWAPGSCLVFFPEEFAPDAEFGRKLEQLADKMDMSLLWIENPGDEIQCWSFTAGTGENPQIMIGEYWLALSSGVEESDMQVSFKGIFGRNEDTFEIAEGKVTLSLGDCYGTMSFSLIVPKDRFVRLGGGIRFWYMLPEDTPGGELCNFTGQLCSHVISPCGNGDVECRCSICPGAVGSHTRTCIGLPAFADWDSAFLSPRGENVLLKSSDHVRLVFQKGAEAYSYDAGRNQYPASVYKWYLGLEGEFAVKQDTILMPGLSGTEYCANIESITFVSGQSGLIRAETDGEPGKIVMAEGTLPAETSWISFRGTYCAAPVTMPFFDMGMSYPRAYIPKIQSNPDGTVPFPAMPWSGMVPGYGRPEEYGLPTGQEQLTEYIQQLERVLAQERYQLLSAGINNAQKGGEAEKLLLAPCGICVGLQPESGNWNWVGLAQTGEEGLPDIRLEHPSADLRRTLQKPDCIVTAQSKEEFSKLGENQVSFSLPADGWILSFSETDWNSHSLFVLKATETVTLRSCLAQTPQLKRVLDMAYNQDGTVREGYGALLRVLDDRLFQGIFLMGGKAGVFSFAPQLQAAFRLVQNGNIEVVYAAVSNSRAVQGASGLSFGRSGIDALVYFQGAPVHQEDGVPFAVCTRDLTAVIEQSRVTCFQSRLELSLYRMFGAGLTPQSQWDGFQIILSGRMECTDRGTSYKFSMERETAYAAADSPIASVLVQDAALTVAEDNLFFELKGLLSFEKWEGLDLFSYEQIGFAGLQLICGDAVQNTVRYDDLRLLAEDNLQEAVKIRPNSFAEAFGAQVDGIWFEREDGGPDSLGYVSINAPVKQGELKGKWNGLVWKVALNSSGQLGKNEPLCLYLLGAWSEGGYYIGIRTEGIFGKTFSVQGILTADFKGITLVQGGEGKLFFRLHSFALRTLGLSFPARGVDVFILGEHGNVAWCAAYEDGGEGDVI